MHHKTFLAALTCGIVFAACSSDSGGGDASALSVPSQMTIVEAEGSGGSGAYIAPPGTAAIEGSDYMTDLVRVWVHDESMEALDTVNDILCSIGQTNFGSDAVLNKGAYTALVGCDQDRDGDKNAEAGQVSYQEFTVISSRSPGQAHIVQFWFDEEMNGQDVRLYGKLTIDESPSTARPFGKFILTWKQIPLTEAHDSTNILMRGSLKTIDRTDGKVEFALHNTGGDIDGPVNPNENHFRTRARVIANATFTEGQGYLENRYAYNPGGGKQTGGAEYHVQFNDRYLARKKVGTSTVTKVFDRDDFTTFAFRYGVYTESTESRVSNESGFPIETAAGRRGYVGYHGMWFPHDVTITNGQTLTRRSYRDGSTTDYTAFIAPGMLVKNTRSNSTLGNMKDEVFETWDKVNNTQIRVSWSGTAFNKVANFDFGQGTWVEITPVNIGSQYSTNDFVHMHNHARGDVQFVWPSAGPADSTAVSIWQNVIINGDSTELANGDLTLYGYFNMLKSNITSNQANYQNNETPYFPDATSVSGKKTYVFDKASLTLQLSSVDVTLGTGVSMNGGPHSNGLDCGPMVTTELTALHDMHSQTTTYNWRTGSEHSSFRTVKDANDAFVAFEAPLRFQYTHTETGNSFDGKSFFLELEGDELRGIPHEKEANGDRWYPGFNIPNGTVLIDGESNRYLVKMLEGEQRINEVNNPTTVIADQGFDLDTTLTPPESSYVDPEVGARPTVTDPPKFINGEAPVSTN